MIFFAQMSGEKHEEVEYLHVEVENFLFKVDEELGGISFFLPAIDCRWQTELKHIWRLFDRVYRELRNVLGGFYR
jgi:hypothetical protein